MPNKNRHKDKKVEKCQGRSFKDKVPVFGMYQRGGKLVAKTVPDTKSTTMALTFALVAAENLLTVAYAAVVLQWRPSVRSMTALVESYKISQDEVTV